MTAFLFIALGLFALIFTAPGIFYPASHRALLQKIVFDEGKVRRIAPFIFLMGLWCLLSGRECISADQYLAGFFGLCYIPLGLLLMVRPSIYRHIMKPFLDKPIGSWVAICVSKSLAGIGFIAWGITLL